MFCCRLKFIQAGTDAGIFAEDERRYSAAKIASMLC